MTGSEEVSLKYYELCCTLLHKWGFSNSNNREEMNAAANETGASYDELRSILKHLRAKYLNGYNNAIKNGKFEGDFFTYYRGNKRPRGRPPSTPGEGKPAVPRLTAAERAELRAARYAATGAGDLFGSHEDGGEEGGKRQPRVRMPSARARKPNAPYEPSMEGSKQGGQGRGRKSGSGKNQPAAKRSRAAGGGAYAAAAAAAAGGGGGGQPQNWATMEAWAYDGASSSAYSYHHSRYPPSGAGAGADPLSQLVAAAEKEQPGGGKGAGKGKGRSVSPVLDDHGLLLLNLKARAQPFLRRESSEASVGGAPIAPLAPLAPLPPPPPPPHPVAAAAAAAAPFPPTYTHTHTHTQPQMMDNMAMATTITTHPFQRQSSIGSQSDEREYAHNHSLLNASLGVTTVEGGSVCSTASTHHTHGPVPTHTHTHIHAATAAGALSFPMGSTGTYVAPPRMVSAYIPPSYPPQAPTHTHTHTHQQQTQADMLHASFSSTTSSLSAPGGPAGSNSNSVSPMDVSSTNTHTHTHTQKSTHQPFCSNMGVQTASEEASNNNTHTHTHTTKSLETDGGAPMHNTQADTNTHTQQDRAAADLFVSFIQRSSSHNSNSSSTSTASSATATTSMA
jgi:hypothetical protein